ncbi:hypothetical protein ONE63_008658 [Megalurothrips usitatus]|uniref:Uncharacterized protein n=1 Tax=Megalurothrips usitatus TaxID=439358 RepID=A0AAV7XR01_9NEOP|nr:hypothetical protein ONE63_008658 [Megalurothrips usitatus]
MCREDPHYQPLEKGALNPFAALSQFRGVKKILGDKGGQGAGLGLGADLAASLACSGDLFSSCFELPSPFFSPTPAPPSSPFLFPVCGDGAGAAGGSTGAAAAAAAAGGPRRGSQDSRTQDSGRKVPRKLSLGPLAATGAGDGSRTAAPAVSSQAQSPAVNAGVDMWCKVGSRWRLKSEVEAEAEAGGGCKRTSPDEAGSGAGASRAGDGLIQGSIFCTQSKASDDYLKMDSELTDRRLSSSSSNLNSLLLAEDDAVAATVLGGYPSVALRRRGSCESGFFSCLGEDYGLPGCDPLSPSDFCSGPARHTLCSSSAASSLFLLDDSAVSTTTVSSGELADLDDLAPNGSGGCGLSSRHHSLLFSAKRSSSIYTDSSEDVSSLGGDPAYWEERGFSTNPAPQQISKIVEYFERKQNSTLSLGPGPSRRPSAKLQPQVSTTTRRFSVNPFESPQTLTDAIRSSDFTFLRKSMGSSCGPKGITAASPPSMPFTRPHISKRCASQRLIVCEGAVKSKLPLFDKKS